MHNAIRRRPLLVFLSALAVPLSVCASTGSTDASYLYVSPQGKANWSGKFASPQQDGTDGPLPDLATARDRVRALRKSGTTGTMTIVLRGGIYWLADTFVLTSEDSQTTYIAYRGEYPIISGGKLITGWKRGTGSLWTAVAAGSFRQLFVGSARAQRARTPNSGFLQMVGPSSQAKPFVMTYQGDDIHPNWAGSSVEVVGLMNWAELRMKILSVDPASHTAQLSADPSVSNRVQNARYWIENDPLALDQAGEWYHDEQTGVVSYWPLPKETLATQPVVAGNLVTLVSLQGKPEIGDFVRDVTFQGIEFRHADWSMPAQGFMDTQAAAQAPSAFKAVGTENLLIEHCTFTQLGGYAIWLGRGSKEDRVLNTEIYDVGAGGVKIGETANFANPDERAEGNIVSDTEMHGLGVVYPGAIGVWIGQSSGNTVSHNHIYDAFYTAISVGWTWNYNANQCNNNRIEYNSLHDLGKQMMSDMGGVYTLGVQPGTVIQNNVIHDVSGFYYGGWGIYPDQGSSDLLIQNNIVYNTNGGGLHQNFGENNIVQNNIFAFDQACQIRLSQVENHLSFTLSKNIIVSSVGKLFWKVLPTAQINADYNLYWNTQGQAIAASDEWKQWRQTGRDAHSVIGDPLFVNASAYDFRVGEGSPALTLGFHQIDTSQVGTRGKPGTAGEPAQPPILSFSVSPSNIQAGQCATLSWIYNDAPSVDIAPGMGRFFAPQSSVQICPRETTAYSLSTQNPSVYSLSATLKVNASSTASQNATTSSMNNVRVYPNPWRPDKNYRQIMFDGLSTGSTIKIFTVSGHPVKTLTASASGNVAWLLTTDNGDQVAGGIYLYVITDRQENQIRGTLGVIR